MKLIERELLQNFLNNTGDLQAHGKDLYDLYKKVKDPLQMRFQIESLDMAVRYIHLINREMMQSLRSDNVSEEKFNHQEML